MPDFRKFIALLSLSFLLAQAMIAPVLGRSAYSPRQSGLEPPGTPRSLHVLPDKSPVTTPDGGKGYIDAYGNPVKMPEQEEQKTHKRLRRGAYGHAGNDSTGQSPSRSLPETETPLWNFQNNSAR